MREECLDHLLVLPRRRLEAVVAEYVADDKRGLPNRSLDLTTRIGRHKPAAPRAVHRRGVLGGVIHECGLVA